MTARKKMRRAPLELGYALAPGPVPAAAAAAACTATLVFNRSSIRCCCCGNSVGGGGRRACHRRSARRGRRRIGCGGDSWILPPFILGALRVHKYGPENREEDAIGHKCGKPLWYLEEEEA